MGALLSQKQHGVKRKLVGLSLKEPGIMRHGQTVYINDQPAGIITSGSYSPTLGHAIAFARLSKEAAPTVQVEIRNKRYTATVTQPRFVKHGKAI
jgi:aminomethyltransferase